LVERHSRYVLLAKVPNRDSQSVITALINQAHRLPDELIKSLTWDRGKEMAQHKRFTLATDAAVYFCDPQSPWQRGSNENTNGLLRQYFPKGTNLSVHTQEPLDKSREAYSGWDANDKVDCEDRPELERLPGLKRFSTAARGYGAVTEPSSYCAT